MNQNGMAEKKYLIFKEIIAAVIHDMKNPLSAITLGLEFIQMVSGEGKVPPQALSGALTSAARMDQLLDALSMYFHDETEAASAIDFSHILNKAQLLVNYYMARKQIKFSARTAEGERAVLANVNQTFQALVMLLIAISQRVASGTKINTAVSSDQRWQILTIDVLENEEGMMWKEPDRNAPQPDLAQDCFEMAAQLLARNGFVLEPPQDWSRPERIIIKKSIDAQLVGNGAGQ